MANACGGRMRIGRLGILACTLFLGACAAPNYEKQVSDLSAGFSKVKSTFDSLEEDERQAVIGAQTIRALNRGSNLEIPDTCALPPKRKTPLKTINCRPSMVASDGVSTSFVIPTKSEQAGKLAGLLVAYGGGLVALASAKDVAELEASVGKARDAIVKLRTDVGGKSARTEPFGAITAAAVWVFGKYLEQRRFDELHKAVAEGDQLVEKAAGILGEDASTIQRNIIVQKTQILHRQNDNLRVLRKNTEADRTLIDQRGAEIAASALALQQLAETDARVPFQKMREAHAKLLEALDYPAIKPDAVFKAISEFADQADKLKKGIDQARKGK